MLKYGRRLGISADTIQAIKVARIAKQLRCLPSQLRDEREEDIAVFMKIEEIEAEQERERNNQ